MRFDDFMDDWGDDAQDPAGVAERIPDGRHTVTIVKSEVRDLSFKATDRNPAGKSLCLTVQLGGYQPAEDLIPVTFGGLIRAVCQSAGVNAPRRGEDWDPRQLEGKRAQVEVSAAIAKSGREYQRIRWVGLPDGPFVETATAPQAAGAARRPRKPAASATGPQGAAGGNHDDIPFVWMVPILIGLAAQVIA